MFYGPCCWSSRSWFVFSLFEISKVFFLSLFFSPQELAVFLLYPSLHQPVTKKQLPNTKFLCFDLNFDNNKNQNKEI